MERATVLTKHEIFVGSQIFEAEYCLFDFNWSSSTDTPAYEGVLYFE